MKDVWSFVETGNIAIPLFIFLGVIIFMEYILAAILSVITYLITDRINYGENLQKVIDSQPEIGGNELREHINSKYVFKKIYKNRIENIIGQFGNVDDLDKKPIDNIMKISIQIGIFAFMLGGNADYFRTIIVIAIAVAIPLLIFYRHIIHFIKEIAPLLHEQFSKPKTKAELING